MGLCGSHGACQEPTTLRISIFSNRLYIAPHVIYEVTYIRRVLIVLIITYIDHASTTLGHTIHLLLGLGSYCVAYDISITSTTRQRRGQWEEVPGSDSNAYTSSFNLSYHHKTPGPPPVRHVQPSDSKCCMSPGRLIRREPRSGGCGCDGRIDIPTPSSPLKSGSLVRSAQEVDAVRKSHSFRRPRAVRSSQTVVRSMRARGGLVLVLCTCLGVSW